jgi:hypothetical protein
VTAQTVAGVEGLPSVQVEVEKAVETRERHYFSIPPAAWLRALGDLPANPASSSPKRGVALGGFGAGSLMYNFCGSFGPFQSLDQVTYQNRWLSGAAFHFFEQVEGEPARTRALVTDDTAKPAWTRLRTGDGLYYALQPKGWVTYRCFAHDLSVKFFSPVIPHNYRQTSYPVAVWEFKVFNPGPKPTVASLLFTFPAAFVGQNFSPGAFHNRFESQGDARAVRLQPDQLLGELVFGHPHPKQRGRFLHHGLGRSRRWSGRMERFFHRRQPGQRAGNLCRAGRGFGRQGPAGSG